MRGKVQCVTWPNNTNELENEKKNAAPALTLHIKTSHLRPCLSERAALDQTVISGNILNGELDTSSAAVAAQQGREAIWGAISVTRGLNDDDQSFINCPGHGPPVCLHCGIDLRISAFQQCEIWRLQLKLWYSWKQNRQHVKHNEEEVHREKHCLGRFCFSVNHLKVVWHVGRDIVKTLEMNFMFPSMYPLGVDHNESAASTLLKKTANFLATARFDCAISYRQLDYLHLCSWCSTLVSTETLRPNEKPVKGQLRRAKHQRPQPGQTFLFLRPPRRCLARCGFTFVTTRQLKPIHKPLCSSTDQISMTEV